MDWLVFAARHIYNQPENICKAQHLSCVIDVKISVSSGTMQPLLFFSACNLFIVPKSDIYYSCLLSWQGIDWSLFLMSVCSQSDLSYNIYFYIVVVCYHSSVVWKSIAGHVIFKW